VPFSAFLRFPTVLLRLLAVVMSLYKPELLFAIHNIFLRKTEDGVLHRLPYDAIRIRNGFQHFVRLSPSDQELA